MKKFILSTIMFTTGLVALQDRLSQLAQTECSLIHQYIDHSTPLYAACTNAVNIAECRNIELYLASVHDRFIRLANVAYHVSADLTKAQQEKEQVVMNRFKAIMQEAEHEHIERVAAVDIALQKLGANREVLYPSMVRLTYDALKDTPLAMRTFMCAR